MYRIHKSIDLDFAHHVGGHSGACINIHGHTWKFEVGLRADSLDSTGFVIDFKQLKTGILESVHVLLDHSLALYDTTVEAASKQLDVLGQILVATRPAGMPCGYKFHPADEDLNGARNVILGGIKIAVFPFSPTSERLAEWLYGVAFQAVSNISRLEHNNTPVGTPNRNLRVDYTRIYETLHPVESVAEFRAE